MPPRGKKPVSYRKKNHIKAAPAACRAHAKGDYVHRPTARGVVSFQLMTTARRGDGPFATAAALCSA